jgi:hypothetical protein
MTRSIFDHRLPNGGLGTAAPKPATVTVAVSEYITPTMQSMKFVGVSQEDVDQANQDGSGAAPAKSDFYSAPNPIIADVKPASSEFGKGRPNPAPIKVDGDSGGTALVNGAVVATVHDAKFVTGNLQGEKP